MLKYYRVTYMTFRENEEIISYSGTTIQEEGAIQNKTFHLNWDNVEEIQKQYGLYLGFNIFKKKKGTRRTDAPRIPSLYLFYIYHSAAATASTWR